MKESYNTRTFTKVKKTNKDVYKTGVPICRKHTNRKVSIKYYGGEGMGVERG